LRKYGSDNVSIVFPIRFKQQRGKKRKKDRKRETKVLCPLVTPSWFYRCLLFRPLLFKPFEEEEGRGLSSLGRGFPLQ